MCPTDRKIAMRGRSAVPEIRLRWRCRMRSRRSFLVRILINSPGGFSPTVPQHAPSRGPCAQRRSRGSLAHARSLCPGLSNLLLQLFAHIPDALLLVRIGLPHAADIGRNLADELAINSGYRDVGLLVHRDINARRNVQDDGVRVAQRKHHLLAFQLRTIADAHDVELFLEAFGDAVNCIGHQAPGKPMKLAQLLVFPIGPGHEFGALHRELDARRNALLQRPFGALDLDRVRMDRHAHALRHDYWLFSYARHVVFPYQTLQSTSPPTPALTASFPVITPCDVVRMAVPSPP